MWDCSCNSTQEWRLIQIKLVVVIVIVVVVVVCYVVKQSSKHPVVKYNIDKYPEHSSVKQQGENTNYGGGTAGVGHTVVKNRMVS